MNEMTNLPDPIREPTHYVNSDNRQDQISDFAMGPLFFLGLILGPDSSQLTNDQEVKKEYQDARYEKAEGKGVESEGSLAVHDARLRPINVAVRVAADIEGVGVHEDRDH